MTDRDALLAVILSDPADDLPRLCFADWLDENGESERAEFIRVQVELLRTDHSQDCRRSRPWKYFGPECTCHVRELDQQGRRLEFVERRRVFTGIEFAYAGDLTSKFRRGFLHMLHCSWADWLHHHEALYWHPKQTVKCPTCNGQCSYNPNDFTERICDCDGAGRISRPFVATAQPITEVELTTAHQITEAELTTWPVWDSSTHHSVGYLDENGRGVDFTRVKCPACGGLGLVNAVNGPIVAGDPVYQCPACRGEPLNKWTCPKWPTITFKMP